MTVNPRWGGLRLEPYDPDADDADGDGIVQEGTAWERPKGTQLVDASGKPIARGTTSATRSPGTRVMRDGREERYTPSYGGQQQGGQRPGKPTPLARSGAPSLRERGLRSLKDRFGTIEPEQAPEPVRSEQPAPTPLTPMRPTPPKPEATAAILREMTPLRLGRKRRDDADLSAPTTTEELVPDEALLDSMDDLDLELRSIVYLSGFVDRTPSPTDVLDEVHRLSTGIAPDGTRGARPTPGLISDGGTPGLPKYRVTARGNAAVSRVKEIGKRVREEALRLMPASLKEEQASLVARRSALVDERPSELYEIVSQQLDLAATKAMAVPALRSQLEPPLTRIARAIEASRSAPTQQQARINVQAQLDLDALRTHYLTLRSYGDTPEDAALVSLFEKALFLVGGDLSGPNGLKYKPGRNGENPIPPEMIPKPLRYGSMCDQAADVAACAAQRTKIADDLFRTNRVMFGYMAAIEDWARKSDQYMKDLNAFQAKAAQYYREALGKLRPLGAKQTNLRVTRSTTTTASDADLARAEADLASGVERLPTDWIEAISEAEELTLDAADGRAFYVSGHSGRPGRITMPTSRNEAYRQTAAVHELTHAAETAVPEVAALEAMFLFSRIDPAETPLELYPGEYAYEDEFQSTYSGVLYPARIGPPVAYEILSTATEVLLSGHTQHGSTALDDDFIDFAMGTLAVAGRTRRKDFDLKAMRDRTAARNRKAAIDADPDIPKEKMPAATEVASRLHESWREGRRRPDGTYEPRMKDDGKGGMIDIANTPFADLPETWQKENMASAKHVIRAIDENPDATDDEIASMVHDAWVARNETWAPDDLKVPFDQLPEDEKDKDRLVVEEARKALEEGDQAKPLGSRADDKDRSGGEAASEATPDRPAAQAEPERAATPARLSPRAQAERQEILDSIDTSNIPALPESGAEVTFESEAERSALSAAMFAGTGDANPAEIISQRIIDEFDMRGLLERRYEDYAQRELFVRSYPDDSPDDEDWEEAVRRVVMPTLDAQQQERLEYLLQQFTILDDLASLNRDSMSRIEYSGDFTKPPTVLPPKLDPAVAVPRIRETLASLDPEVREVLTTRVANQASAMQAEATALKRESEIRRVRNAIADKVRGLKRKQFSFLDKRASVKQREHTPGKAIPERPTVDPADHLPQEGVTREVEDITALADATLQLGTSLAMPDPETTQEAIELLASPDMTSTVTRLFTATPDEYGNLRLRSQNEYGFWSHSGVQALSMLGTLRGYDSQALKVSAEELDDMVVDGGFHEMRRGGSPVPQQEHISGQMLYGDGLLGGGYYFAIQTYSEDGDEIPNFDAGSYAGDEGLIIRAGLNPNARILGSEIAATAVQNYRDAVAGRPITNKLTDEVVDVSDSTDPAYQLAALRKRLTAIAEGGGPDAAQARQAITNLDTLLSLDVDDMENTHSVGVAAILMGYDAVSPGISAAPSRGGDNRVLLYNRSAAIVQPMLETRAEHDATRGRAQLVERVNPKRVAEGRLPAAPSWEEEEAYIDTILEQAVAEADSRRAEERRAEPSLPAIETPDVDAPISNAERNKIGGPNNAAPSHIYGSADDVDPEVMNILQSFDLDMDAAQGRLDDLKMNVLFKGIDATFEVKQAAALPTTGNTKLDLATPRSGPGPRGKKPTLKERLSGIFKQPPERYDLTPQGEEVLQSVSDAGTAARRAIVTGMYLDGKIGLADVALQEQLEADRVSMREDAELQRIYFEGQELYKQLKEVAAEEGVDLDSLTNQERDEWVANSTKLSSGTKGEYTKAATVVREVGARRRATEEMRVRMRSEMRDRLAEFIPMGGSLPNLKVEGLENASPEDAQKWNDIIAEALSFMPTQWLNAIDSRGQTVGDLRIVIAPMPDDSGYRSRYSPTERTVYLELPASSFSLPMEELEEARGTMLHELVHAAEDYVPELRMLEQLFYAKRTAGDTGTLEYLDKENVFADSFFDLYAGKTYGSGVFSSYELLTMGMQTIFGFNSGLTTLPDTEYLDFVLGALLSTGRTDASAGMGDAAQSAMRATPSFSAPQSRPIDLDPAKVARGSVAGRARTSAEIEAANDAIISGVRSTGGFFRPSEMTTEERGTWIQSQFDDADEFLDIGDGLQAPRRDRGVLKTLRLDPSPTREQLAVWAEAAPKEIQSLIDTVSASRIAWYQNQLDRGIDATGLAEGVAARREERARLEAMKAYIESRSTDELYDDIAAFMRSIIDDSDTAIAVDVPEARLDGIVADRGIYRTVHEVSGDHSPAQAREHYEVVTGLPYDAPADLRPASGYVIPGPRRRWARSEEAAGEVKTAAELERSTNGYGGVQLLLKPEVRGRSKITPGDSFNASADAAPMTDPTDEELVRSVIANLGGMRNTPKGDGTMESFFRVMLMLANPELQENGHGFGLDIWGAQQYTEAMIYGSFDLSDVEAITYTPEIFWGLEELKEKHLKDHRYSMQFRLDDDRFGAALIALQVETGLSDVIDDEFLDAWAAIPKGDRWGTAGGIDDQLQSLLNRYIRLDRYLRRVEGIRELNPDIEIITRNYNIPDPTPEQIEKYGTDDYLKIRQEELRERIEAFKERLKTFVLERRDVDLSTPARA